MERNERTTIKTNKQMKQTKTNKHMKQTKTNKQTNKQMKLKNEEKIREETHTVHR